MPTLTSNFDFNKPLVNNATDADLWGAQLNTNFDDIDGLFPHTTSSKTASFSVGAAEFNYLYIVDTTSGDVTATLPAVANVYAGFTVAFKVIDATNDLIIDGNASETIDGATTKTYSTAYDFVRVTCDGTGWHLESVALPLASNAQVTSETAGVLPAASQLKYHEGVAKAWGKFNDAGTLSDSYGVTSVTKNSTGNFTVNLSVTMSNANYAIAVTNTKDTGAGNGTNLNSIVEGQTTTTFGIKFGAVSNVADDPDAIYFVIYGTLA